MEIPRHFLRFAPFLVGTPGIAIHATLQKAKKRSLFVLGKGSNSFKLNQPKKGAHWAAEKIES